MVVFVDGAIVVDEKTVKVPKRHPLVEVKCGNCSHCRFVRELTRFAHGCSVREEYVDPYGEACGDSRFGKNAAEGAMLHRRRLASGLDRPDELDRMQLAWEAGTGRADDAGD